MDELYQAIEEKIKAAGYPREISGQAVYEDICDQIEGKENGSYVLLSKFEDDVIFEYHITIMDHESHFSVDFVNECVKEIEEIMTPKAPEVEEEDKENPDAGE